MLRLERVFSVADDVLPLLPPLAASVMEAAALADADPMDSALSSAGPDAQALLLRERNIKVVGQERGGLILFTWDGYRDEGEPPNADKVTFVELLQMPERTRTLLYVHHSVANIVHASVNQDRNLLVFTVYQRSQAPLNTGAVEGELQDIYETCMAEIQPQSRVFSLGNPSRKFQRVQFLPIHADNGQRARQQKALYYLLFIVHKEYIHAYSLPMSYIKANNAKPGWRIVEQPRKEYQVAKKFLWYQWDMPTQTLYYLYAKPNPKEQMNKLELMLRGVVFVDDGKSEITYDSPIPIKLRPNLPEDTDYINLPCARAVPDAWFHMEVVRTDANTHVACYQAPYDDKSGHNQVQVTVVLLQRLSKLDFVIPLNNFAPEVVARTRVAFTTLNHMLLIYLAGHYLQLVDCSSEHEPSPSLYFTGSELVTPFPDHVEDDVRGFGFTTQMELFANDTAELGFALYDCRFDRAYRYTFAEEALLAFFARAVPQIAHVQSLHLAIVHLPDTALAVRAMQQMCATQSHLATADVLKEFLIGMTYTDMRDKHGKEHGAAALLRLLPVTTIVPFGAAGADEASGPSLEDRRTSFGRSGTMEDIAFLSRGVPPGAASGGRPHRFSAEAALASYMPSVALPVQPMSSAASQQTALVTAASANQGQRRGPLSTFFGRLLSPLISDPSPTLKLRTASSQSGFSAGSNTSLGLMNAPSEEEEEDLQHRQRLIDVLTDFLTAGLPRDVRPRAAAWASSYTASQKTQAANLWNVVDDTLRTLPNLGDQRDGPKRPTTEHFAIFQLMEALYSALEELHFPFPDGLHTKFAVHGLHCLPRHVFVQYLDRGVFRTTKSFTEHVIQLLRTSTAPEDCHFRTQMVARMRNKQRALMVLKRLPEHKRLTTMLMVQSLLAEGAPAADASDDDDAGDGDASVVMNLDGLSMAENEAALNAVDYKFIPLNVFAQHLRVKGLQPAEVKEVLATVPLDMS